MEQRLFKLHKKGYIKEDYIFKDNFIICNTKYNLLNINEFKKNIIKIQKDNILIFLVFNEDEYYINNKIFNINNIKIIHKNNELVIKILNNDKIENYIKITDNIFDRKLNRYIDKYKGLIIKKLNINSKKYIYYENIYKLKLKRYDLFIYLLAKKIVKIKFKIKNGKLYMVFYIPKIYKKYLFDIIYFFK